jgi:hypothetical protein
MSHGETIDRATAAHTTRNIGLAGRLLRQMLAAPELLDDIPDGANLIVLPYDDPATTLRNVAQALRLAARGETVLLRRINGPTQETERTLARMTPDIDRANLSLSVDVATGTMTFDFTGVGSVRQLAWFPIGEAISLLVESPTLDVVSYRIPESLLAHLHERTDEPGPPDCAAAGYRIVDAATAVSAFTEDLVRRAA